MGTRKRVANDVGASPGTAAKFLNDPAFAKYAEKAAENAGGNLWKPRTPNEFIGGNVVSMKTQAKGKYRPNQMLLGIKTAGGLVSHFPNVQLQEAIEGAKIAVGDKICITFVGTYPSKKGHPGKTFGVVKI